MDRTLIHQFGDIDRRHWWFQGRRRIVGEVLRRRLPLDRWDRPRILDVGCGTGGLTAVLTEFGTVTGIDASPEAIDYARQLLGDAATFAVGRVPDAVPAMGAADVVTAFDVIEHLDDDVSAVRTITSVLPGGGMLAVTVPAFQVLWGPHDVLSEHRRRYRKGQLRKVLESAGMRVTYLSYFNASLFPAVAAVRVGRRLVPGREREPRSDFVMPARWVNRTLAALFGAEATVLRRTSLPFGVSLLALCEKP